MSSCCSNKNNLLLVPLNNAQKYSIMWKSFNNTKPTHAQNSTYFENFPADWMIGSLNMNYWRVSVLFLIKRAYQTKKWSITKWKKVSTKVSDVTLGTLEVTSTNNFSSVSFHHTGLKKMFLNSIHVLFSPMSLPEHKQLQKGKKKTWKTSVITIQWWSHFRWFKGSRSRLVSFWA